MVAGIEVTEEIHDILDQRASLKVAGLPAALAKSLALHGAMMALFLWNARRAPQVPLAADPAPAVQPADPAGAPGPVVETQPAPQEPAAEQPAAAQAAPVRRLSRAAVRRPAPAAAVRARRSRKILR
jgi:hypothetical protein